MQTLCVPPLGWQTADSACGEAKEKSVTITCDACLLDSKAFQIYPIVQPEVYYQKETN